MIDPTKEIKKLTDKKDKLEQQALKLDQARAKPEYSKVPDDIKVQNEEKVRLFLAPQLPMQNKMSATVSSRMWN